MSRSSLLSPLFVLLAACGPVTIETPAQVDNNIISGDFESACLALQMPDDALRTYAAEKLSEHPDQQVATDCVCKALYDAEAGKYDAAVAEGLKDRKRDDLAQCAAKALEDDRVADRAALGSLVSGMHAEAGYDALATAVKRATDPAVRVGALQGLVISERHVPSLVEALADADPSVRVAAARALAGRKGESVVPALVAVATGDADPSVRAAALVTLGPTTEADATICSALLGDAEESVRVAAAQAFTKQRRPEVVDCLKKRVLKQEDSEAVRAHTLNALRLAGTADAKKVLCDAMGPYVRMYVKDALPPEESPLDIVFLQNDVDYESSYACVTKAMSQGGHSCYGRYHLAAWNNALGGKARASRCPGMAVEGTGGGGGEISFE